MVLFALPLWCRDSRVMSPKSSSQRTQNTDDEESVEQPSSSSLVKLNEPKTELSLPLRILNDHITCSLCKGYFVDATTVLDCLHTFCKSCLLKHFDEEDNTCPKCQTLIHQSHPTHYVAFDRTMQDIVYKLVPGMQELEASRRAEFEANRSSDSEEEYEDGVSEADTINKTATENGVEEADSSDCCIRDPCAGHRREKDPHFVILEPTSNLPALERAFIRMPGLATVNTIKRYIALMLKDDITHYQSYDIFCNNELMGRDYTMEFIFKTRWRNHSSDPMRLIYAPHFEH